MKGYETLVNGLVNKIKSIETFLKRQTITNDDVLDILIETETVTPVKSNNDKVFVSKNNKIYIL